MYFYMMNIPMSLLLWLSFTIIVCHHHSSYELTYHSSTITHVIRYICILSVTNDSHVSMFFVIIIRYNPILFVIIVKGISYNDYTVSSLSITTVHITVSSRWSVRDITVHTYSVISGKHTIPTIILYHPQSKCSIQNLSSTRQILFPEQSVITERVTIPSTFFLCWKSYSFQRTLSSLRVTFPQNILSLLRVILPSTFCDYIHMHHSTNTFFTIN